MAYKILRFSQTEDTIVIKRGLTLQEAQEHCKRADTKGEEWFDSYEEE